MILLVVPKWFRNGYVAMAFFPFVFLNHSNLKKDRVLLNHERIHLRQQLEMLLVIFYLWYGIEFLLRWYQYKSTKAAYRHISFEQEAYANEHQLDYLQKRKFWQFRDYLFGFSR